MGLVQKIALCILTAILGLGLGAVIVSILLEFHSNKDVYWISIVLLLLLICILAALSFIFHLKTISLYKDSLEIINVYTSNKVIWITNFIFGIVLILFCVLCLITAFMLEKNNFSNNTTIFYQSALPSFIISFWIFIDYYFLFNKYKKAKSQIKFNQIDEIKGEN